MLKKGSFFGAFLGGFPARLAARGRPWPILGRPWRNLGVAKNRSGSQNPGPGRIWPDLAEMGRIRADPGGWPKSGFGTKNPGLAGSWPGPAGTRIRAGFGPDPGRIRAEMGAGAGPWGAAKKSLFGRKMTFFGHFFPKMSLPRMDSRSRVPRLGPGIWGLGTAIKNQP